MESNTWAKVDETILEFEVQNPHREGSAAYGKFEAIKQCASVGEAKLKGASTWDLTEYYKKGSLKVLVVAEPKAKGWGGGSEKS